MRDDPQNRPEVSSRGGALSLADGKWVAALVALHLALTLPVIFFPGAGNDFDERTYHYPAVVQIRQHWPRLDLVRDCLSPIAPGYHYFLATCSLFTGESLLAMRLVNDAVSLLIPPLFFLWLRRSLAAREACLYTLPLALCAFFLKASCRVVTDNAALLTLLLSLLCIFLLPARGWRGTFAGMIGTVAVFVRQLNVSLVAPSLLHLFIERFHSAEIGGGQAGVLGRARQDRSFALALLFRLLPIVGMGYLVYTWHGLVPGAWQTVSVTLSTAPLAYLLSVAAILGTCFALSLGPAISRKEWTSRWVLGAMLLGFGLTLVSPNTWSPSEGRWGGWLWLLVVHLPSVAKRSAVFMILTPLGAGILCLFYRLLWSQGQQKWALLWGGSVLAWMSSYAVATNIYHHYYEAPLMIFFGAGCAMILRRAPTLTFRWPALIPLLGYEIVLTVLEIYAKVFLSLNVSDLHS